MIKSELQLKELAIQDALREDTRAEFKVTKRNNQDEAFKQGQNERCDIKES